MQAELDKNNDDPSSPKYVQQKQAIDSITRDWEAEIDAAKAEAAEAAGTAAEAAAKAGCYGQFARSAGPQIRGGEAAAMVRLASEPVDGPGDIFGILVAIDWHNIERFAVEASHIMMFARAVADANPIYHDDELPLTAAKKVGGVGTNASQNGKDSRSPVAGSSRRD